MKPFFCLVVTLALGGHINAQETTSSNVMDKLNARPDLLSAWNALNDSTISSPAEKRQNVLKLMVSGDDDIRLLVMREKRDYAFSFLEAGPPPTLSDSAFLAQAMLASALSNQPTPGGEEQASQRGMVVRLGQMLRKSLSTETTAAEAVNWEGETRSDVTRWLQNLTNALLSDKRASDLQHAAAIKLRTYVENPVLPRESLPNKQQLEPSIQTGPTPNLESSQKPQSTGRSNALESNTAPTSLPIERAKPSYNLTIISVAIFGAVILGFIFYILRLKSK